MELNGRVLEILETETAEAILETADKEVIGFVNGLGDKELTALNIAVSQLASSFDITRAIGFLASRDD